MAAEQSVPNLAPMNKHGEQCVFGNADCGPVEVYDDHGCPACRRCFEAERDAAFIDMLNELERDADVPAPSSQRDDAGVADRDGGAGG